MRIYSKKALRFDHPSNAEPAVHVQMHNFADVPAWVADSAMYKLASQDDTVELIESRQDEIEVEKGGKTSAKAKREAEAKAKAEAEAKAKEEAEAAAKARAEEEAAAAAAALNANL